MYITSVFITTKAVDIAVSPERLFAFITNPDHVKEWQPDLLEYEFLTEGGIRPGARIRAAMLQPGRGRVDAELTVVTVTPPEHLVYHSEERTSSVDFDYQLSRSPRGASLVVSMDIRLKGFLRLLTVVARPMIRRKLDALVLLLRDAAQAKA
jgi:uncharacterized protein YndB with AHSA1/START domain